MTIENEVMTLTEVAHYLQLAEKTILRMAQRGEIPAAKVASQWRFLRPVIKDWLAARMHSLSGSSVSLSPAVNEVGPSLREVIRPELIRLDIAPGSKEAVLRQLIEPLQQTGFAASPEALLEGLLEREQLMTTAVGHGIAIPHPRQPLKNMFTQPAIALGICPLGTDFNAIDDQPVRIFFLICATREGIHLELMAKVAWLGRQQDLMTALTQCRSQNEAVDRLATAMHLLES